MTSLTLCRQKLDELLGMTSILCATDDPHLCKIFEKAFVSENYEVVTAHDGESAIRAFESRQPQLAIVDILLPKRDGFGVLETIRQSDAEGTRTPVVLLSSCRVTSQYRDRARALHAQALLAKPVPLERLMKVVRKHTKAPPPAVKTAPKDRIPLRGSFSEISFPHLLHQLHGLRATGVLSAGIGKKRKLIQLREGYPEAIKSNLVGECLGNELVRKGRISQEMFDESVQRMKRGEGLQGQILIAMQVLDEEELAAALREQARNKLFEIFRWTEGRFRFQLGGELERANSLSLKLAPANLILEGVRCSFPVDHIDRFFQRHASRCVAPGASDFYRLQDIDLLPAEQGLVSTLDGTGSLSKFDQCDERIRRTIYGLLLTEVLELRDPVSNSRIPFAPANKAANALPLLHSSKASAAPADQTSAAGGTIDVNKDHVLRTELGKLATTLRGQNYFEMLGVSEADGGGEIDAAFEKRVRRLHPDKYANSSDAVRQLADEAYSLLVKAHETLSNGKRRTLYLLEIKKNERLERKKAADRRALDAELEFQKGTALLKAREYESALVSFGRALEMNSKEGEYLAAYGWCLYLCHPNDDGMVQEAIEHVRRGVKRAPNRETPYLYLGRLHKAVGRMAAAEKMFTRALQILPESVEAMRELRLINLRREKKGLIGRLLRR